MPKRARSPSISLSDQDNGEDSSMQPDGAGGAAGPATRPMTASCGACRDRKVKCTGRKPTCENCDKSGRTCEYRPKLKPGLKTGAGQVEKRLAEAERLLTEHSEQLAFLHDVFSSNGSIFPPSSSSHPVPFPFPSLPSNSSNPSQADFSPHLTLPSFDPSSFIASTPSAGSSFSAPYPRAADRADSIHSHPSPGTLPSLHASFLPQPALVRVPENRAPDPVPSRFSTGVSQPTFVRPEVPSSRQLQRDQIWGVGSSSAGTGSLSAPSSNPFDVPDLPPAEIVQELVALYLRHIQPWSPLLISPDLISPLTPMAAESPHSATASNAAAAVPSPSVLLSHGRPSLLVYAIVCISLRFSNNPYFAAHGPTSKAAHHQAAKQRIILKAMDRMSLISLQALSLLTLDWMEGGGGPSSWGGVLSLLAGGVIHAGIDEEEPVVRDLAAARANVIGKPPRAVYVATTKATLFPTTSDWKEVEERRRLFWQVYILDRLAALSCGWDFSFQDGSVGRRLPSTNDAWTLGPDQELPPFLDQPRDPSHPPLPTFSYLVILVQILGSIHAFIRRPLDLGDALSTGAWYLEFRTLETRLLAFFDSLPPHLQEMATGQWDPAQPHPEPGLAATLLAVFHATTLRLHSASAYPPVSSPTFLPSDTASSICVSAARSMARIAALVGSHSIGTAIPVDGPIDAKDVSPLFNWSLWVGARTLVAHSYIKRVPLLSDTAIFVESLRSLSPYWPTAKRYARILTSALREAHVLNPTPAFGSLVSSPASAGYEPVSTTIHGGTGSMLNILADMRKTAQTVDNTIREERLEGDTTSDDARASPSSSPRAGSPPQSSGPRTSHLRGTPSAGPSPEFAARSLPLALSAWAASPRTLDDLSTAAGPSGSRGAMLPPSTSSGSGTDPLAGLDGELWAAGLFEWFEVSQISRPPSPQF